MLNGGLVTLVRLPAFIVTLGTLNIAFALTHIVSNDLTFSGLPSELLFFGRTFTLGGANFTYGVVFMLVLYAIAWFALTQTAWGRHVYAVGDNPEAARLTGINTNRVLLSVYTLAGLDCPGSRRCCSSRAPSSAIRTRARRPRTSTASPRSSSAARASSAGAAASSGRSSAP